jgi:hypothetical protein
VFVGLGCSQGFGGVQLDQIIFEDAFNIWLEADRLPTFRRAVANRQHLTDQDNTSRIRTTPHGSGQHPAFVV